MIGYKNRKSNSRQVKAADQIDTVTMDVPLLIRIMEYCREDIKTDVDLHKIATNMVNAKRVLTMADYEVLVTPHQNLARLLYDVKSRLK